MKDLDATGASGRIGLYGAPYGGDAVFSGSVVRGEERLIESAVGSAKALEALALSDELSKSDDALRRVDRVERTVMISAEARQVLSSDGSKWG
ncbi:hypothetical protein F2Q69_00057360 [Brassica cretica]|uniref:Uncharacterized protein n=1 Tax=Brassica cretica TaxID=69181 RepID=A0A8S9MXU9_BRACR|nr:hypothetical protein F2Q69_00057360 [Brassica cretica]